MWVQLYKLYYSDYPKSLIRRINEVYVFSMKYHYSDTLLKKHKLHLSRLFCCNHTCYCVNMVSVKSASHCITSASYYYLRYQSRSSMYIRGLIPQNFPELAKAVPIAVRSVIYMADLPHCISNLSLVQFNTRCFGKQCFDSISSHSIG